MPEAKYSSTNIFLLDFVCAYVPTCTCEREITLYNPLYTLGGSDIHLEKIFPAACFEL